MGLLEADLIDTCKLWLLATLAGYFQFPQTRFKIQLKIQPLDERTLENDDDDGEGKSLLVGVCLKYTSLPSSAVR